MRESQTHGIDSLANHFAQPGTTRYFDDPERPQIATDRTTGLKCDTSGPLPIILVPQPSDDPNDPLVSIRYIYMQYQSLRRVHY